MTARLHPDVISTLSSEDESAPASLPTRTVRIDEGRVLRVRQCRLTVDGGGGQTLTSDAERIRVGADPESDLPLAGDPTVSRHHCEVLFTERGYLVVDQGSTNGTFVDGRRVERAYLGSRSEVRAGNTRLLFEAVEERLVVEPHPEAELAGLVGGAPSMRALFGMVRKVAPMVAPVLLYGETGVGKEAVARALHALSGRKGDFVQVELAGVEGLDALLFGAGGEVGALDRAKGGTLFLDGVDELPRALQPRLSRALEVDGSVRIISSARTDLLEAVRSGEVRSDLYFRLSVLPLAVPPLRERREDVPALLSKALAQAEGRATVRGFTPGALEALGPYEWPGNVRELINLVAHLKATATAEWIDRSDLPARFRGHYEPAPLSFNEHLTFKAAKEQLLERFEREYLRDLLKRCEGNLSRAARESGMHRKSIERLVKKYQLDVRALRGR